MAVMERSIARVPVSRGVEETLALYDVEYSFGMRIFEEGDYSATRPIPIHHEASAALMAYGYARLSGKPGIVALNRAGTSNVLMGMHEAWQSSVPLIVFVD